jgi:membrane protease YdiL (CAAX protease family)
VPPRAFYLAAFVWSWTWWAIAAAAGGVDGAGALPFLLGGAGPLVAAIVTARRFTGRRYRTALRQRTVNPSLVPLGWWAVVVAVGAGPRLVAHALAAAAGAHQPALQPLWSVSVVGVVVFALVAGFAEEPGWRGVALDGLRNRHTLAVTALAIGVLWSLWHLPLYLVAGTFHNDLGILSSDFTALSLSLVPLTVLFVCIQRHTGFSILAVVVAHSVGNITGELVPAIATTRWIELGLLTLAASIAIFQLVDCQPGAETSPAISRQA